jgi:hypothetical protein
MTGTGLKLTAQTYPIARLRLAEEIHRRAYHDIGIEVCPGAPAAELERTYTLATPYCKKGRSVLTQLSWHVDRTRLAGEDGSFGSWQEFCEHAFVALGASQWRTREHLGCFHRRGKAMYDVAFSVMTRLILAGPADSGATAWALTGSAEWDQPFVRIITKLDGRIKPDRPSRYLAVVCCGEPLAALRSDGWAATSRGSLRVDEMWWRGADAERQADAIRQVAGHVHGR